MKPRTIQVLNPTLKQVSNSSIPHTQCCNMDFMMNTVFLYALFEPRCEKTGFGVSDQVPHKLGCTTTEDSYRLEISDLESRGIVLSV